VYISVSTKHAAAIDNKGNLFTWGTGTKGELCHTGIHKVSYPLMFQSALLLSSKAVVCFKELTGVLTSKNLKDFFISVNSWRSFMFIW